MKVESRILLRYKDSPTLFVLSTNLVEELSIWHEFVNQGIEYINLLVSIFCMIVTLIFERRLDTKLKTIFKIKSPRRKTVTHFLRRIENGRWYYELPNIPVEKERIPLIVQLYKDLLAREQQSGANHAQFKDTVI